MERRLLTFFIAWTALFLLFNALRPAPPPPPPVPAVPGDAVPGDAVPGAAGLADAGDTEPLDAAEGVEEAAETDDDEQSEGEPRRPQRAELITLGSMDPADDYALLMTVNTRGGGVERVEVTARDDSGGLKYHRVDVRHGYLGYLGTRAALDRADGASGGAEVSVVGPGTPADIAGLRVGDVIQTIDGQSVTDEDSIAKVLLQTRPDQTVPVDIVRGDKRQTLSARLTNHPLDLIRLATTAGVDQVAGNETRLSCLMNLAAVGKRVIQGVDSTAPGTEPAAEMIWQSERTMGDDGDVRIELTCPMSAAETGGGGVTLRRGYTLHRGSYVVDMDVSVTNDGPSPQDLAYRLEGPNGLTLEGWWYSNKITRNFMGGSAARDVIYDLSGESTPQLLSGFNLLKKARAETDQPREVILAGADAEQAPDLDFVGIDTQYFLVSYLAGQPGQALDQYRRVAAGVVADPDEIGKYKDRAVNTTFYIDSDVRTLAAGETMTDSLRMFAGPKDPEVLRPYGLQEAVYYGWFSWFAKILAGLLHWFAGLGNYALAIMLLTVMVRGLMFPLSRKAAVNAQKMQALAPELKKIGEQYKDDMEGRLRAQQALQKKAGFNPLAGCLPMFIQFPIFIGLYRALAVDIELRQQPLIPGIEWASNLAGPDMLAYWGDALPDFFAGRGTGWLGPYFNVLPIIVVVLFLAQQKMFMPPATDDQTRLTQRMMSVMTLMMGLFFFKVPAGLCVYFITSSLWGIAERVFVKKTIKDKPAPLDLELDAATSLVGVDKPVKSSKLAEKLRDRINKPEPTFERPNKRKRPGRK